MRPIFSTILMVTAFWLTTAAGATNLSGNVRVTDVTLDTAFVTLTVGASKQLTATVVPVNADNQNITWRTSDATVATVEGGLVRAVGPGWATITVTTDDGQKEATCSVLVLPVKVTDVVLNITELTLKLGDSARLTATVMPDSATNKRVRWSTFNQSRVTVDNGLVRATGVGTAAIVVITEDGDKRAFCTVTVVDPKPVYIYVTDVVLDRHSMTLTVGDSDSLRATIVPDSATNQNVSWISSDTRVVTVDEGHITAVREGTATVTVITEDGFEKDYCDVTVRGIPPPVVPVTGVSLNRRTATVAVGKTVRLSAAVQPTHATNRKVLWSSSDTTVATVANGLVAAVKEGTASVTATTDEGQFTGTCVLTVVKHLDTDPVNPEPTAVPDERTEPMNACPNPTRGQLTVVSDRMKVGDAIEVFNLLGRRVAVFTASSTASVISLDGLAAGIYIIRAKGMVTKVVKER